MANALHKTRMPADYRLSVNTPDFPPEEWFLGPDVSAVAGVPTKYWVLGQTVTEMDAGQKAAVDQAEAAAATTSDREASKLEVERRVLTALVKVLIDELNTLRQWDMSLKSAVAAASTIAALRTNVAALPNLADRTGSQAVTAIKNEIDLL